MDQPPNTHKRLLDAAKEVRLPAGPRTTFEDIAERFHVSIPQLKKIIEREERRHTLTAREKEVLIAYAQGEILKHISVSEKTASAHLTNIKRKFGLWGNRAKAVHYCIMAGWIPLGFGLSDELKASALAEAAKGQQ